MVLYLDEADEPVDELALLLLPLTLLDEALPG